MKKSKFQMITLLENEDGCEDSCTYAVALNGKVLTTYGDDYHDKGSYKMDAFVEGYNSANKSDFKTEHITLNMDGFDVNGCTNEEIEIRLSDKNYHL